MSLMSGAPQYTLRLVLCRSKAPSPQRKELGERGDRGEMREGGIGGGIEGRRKKGGI